MAGACLIAGSAAAQMQYVSAEGREILDNLSPEFRDYVLSLMGPDQTVRGIVETTILNRLSGAFAEVESMAYDETAQVWEVVVVTTEGTRRGHRIDYVMLDQFYVAPVAEMP
jgi:hypothetical protein